MAREKQLFTISQLSRKLDIPKHTLRFWEKELDGIIVPLRTRGGQRRYNYEHVSAIEQIKRFRGKGLGLAEIKERCADMNKMETHHFHFKEVELLANRIAEVVRVELSHFFQRKDEGPLS